MHYATIVAVEIEPCTADEIRISEVESMLRRIQEEKKKNPEHGIMLNIYESEVRMHSTTFSDAMANEVDAVMEPYSCNTDNPEYLEFEDKTEEYREAYENETVNLVRFPNGTVLTDRQYAFFHKYEIVDGRLYERNWGPLHHRKRTKRCKRMQVRMDVPCSEFYDTFEEFVEEEYGTPYVEEQKAYGYYYNPDAFYDWYSIGGRWPDMFLVKEDCMEYGIADRSWACGDEETKVPEGYRWTCAARKKDIAWQVMYDWAVKQAKERYARLSHAFETGILPEGHYGRVTEDGILLFGELAYRKGETEEEYLGRYPAFKRKKYPIHVYAFLMGGVWITADQFIMDGENSRIEDNPEWEDDLEQFIDGLDDETVLAVVDCHM